MVNTNIRYAGFFARLLALLIDVTIVGVIPQIAAEWLNIPSLLESIVLTIIWWLYTAFCISKWKGTVGSRLVGLYVLKTDLEALSFWQASARHFYFIVYIFSFSLLTALVRYLAYDYGESVFLLLILWTFPLAMMLFSKQNQTLHDYLAKSIVVDAFDGQIILDENVHEESTGSVVIPKVRKAARVLFIVVFVMFWAYSLFYMSVIYIASGGLKSRSYEPVTTLSKTIDYNNTKIDYYKSELEKATAEFIEAETMYDIFRGDVKKDLTLNCIRFFVRQKGNDDWLDEGSAYRDNARNAYATTVEKVKKAYKNEDYMGHHFYDYDLNDVNQIEDEIADMWDLNANKETCEQMMSAEKMYGLFILKYIENREETKERDTWELQRAKKRDDKEFYAREVKEITKWLEELHRKHPEYSVYKAEKNEMLQKKKQVREAKKREEKQARKSEDLWNAAVNGAMYGMDYFKDVDANIRNEEGQTPLMLAVKNGSDNTIMLFNNAIVDVWAKDNEGRTAFDYIKKTTNREEKMYADRLYGSLRMLEVYQIVRGKANVVESGYRNKTDILTITLSHGDCTEFKFPKNTKCQSR